MLKIYAYKGRRFQFEESEAPEGAVEIKKKAPANKAKAPANKSRKVTTK